MLQKVQQTMVERQVEQYLEQQASCPKCGKHRQRKGVHSLVFRTLFGKLRLRSERLFHCVCQPHPTRSYSPLAHLLSERTAPELLYLETKFASLISYGLTVDLLQEVLPIGLDGGYVHSCAQRSRKNGWFEVIAGKSVTAERSSKRFAFVQSYDNKPKRRVFEVLKSQGMQANQQVTFLSDGADNVRDLQLYLNPTLNTF